jgi:plastocyanin
MPDRTDEPARPHSRRATRRSLAITASVVLAAAPACGSKDGRAADPTPSAAAAAGTCPGDPAPELHVTVHVRPQVPQFDSLCYVVASGTTAIRLTNEHALPHNVALYAGEVIGNAPPLGATAVIQRASGAATATSSATMPPVTPGRYQVYCQVHPLMTARVDVR